MLRAALFFALAPACASVGEGALLIVLNKSDATAQVVDPKDGATLAVLPTGIGPHEGVVSPDGKLLVVADYGDQKPGASLTLIDLAARTRLGAIDLGPFERPHGLAFVPGTSRLLVTCEVKRALLEVDVIEGRVLRSMDTGAASSHMVAVAPDGSRAFVANIADGSLTALDLKTGERIATVATGAGCEGIDVSPDGEEVWTSNREAGTVSIVDTDTLEVVATLDAPGFPIRVKCTPDGRLALVSCAMGNEVRVFECSSRKLVGAIPMAYAPVAGAESHLLGEAFAGQATPIGIQIHPDGTRAYVANTNANVVAVIDLESLQIVGAIGTGEQPDGLAFRP